MSRGLAPGISDSVRRSKPMLDYTTPTARALQDLLRERLVVLDGAMGTMLQSYRLSEDDFRGALLRDHPSPLRGNSDLLSLTQPAVVEEIHWQYLQAGADVIQTNTFTANRVSQADYGLEGRVQDLNRAAVVVARQAATAFQARDDGRPVFVAGALGPTTRTASISPDVSDPAYRAVNFDQLVVAHR